MVVAIFKMLVYIVAAAFCLYISVWAFGSAVESGAPVCFPIGAVLIGVILFVLTRKKY